MLTFVYIIGVYGGTYPWYMVQPITIACLGPTRLRQNPVLLGTLMLSIVLMSLYALPLKLA
jgi:hypothetical protein